MRQQASGRLISLAVFIYSASLAVFGVYPLLAGIYADHLHLTLQQIGWVLSLEQFGSVAGAILAYTLMQSVSWRWLLFGAAGVSALANLACGVVDSATAVAGLRFLSGAGMVLAATMCVSLLAAARDPARAFGAALLLNSATNIIDIGLLGFTSKHYGYRTALASGAIWFVLAAVAALLVPVRAHLESRLTETTAPGTPAVQGSSSAGVLTLLALLLWGISNNGLWDYVERIALTHGLSAEQVSWGLGIGLVGGLPSALFTTVVGSAGGVVRMIAVTTGIFCGCVLLLAFSHSSIGFATSQVLFNSAWNMGNAYYWTLTAQYDRGGKLVRVMYLSTVVSTALGPLLAGLTVTEDDPSLILIAAPLTAALAVALALLARRAARRPNPTPTPVSGAS
jgi:predicted MFS family arabinose efflux permease